jgi:quinol monooxygenase YgiN
MFIAILELRAPPEKREEMLRTLKFVEGPTAAEPACQWCECLEDVENDGHILFFEVWLQQEDFEEHARKHQYRSVLSAIDMATEMPRFLMGTVSEVQGLGYLKQLLKMARE